MDIAGAVAFARANHRMILATRRADGRPQMSPVVGAVDNDGRVLISSREPAMKTRNIRRNPTVSVCVLNDGFFGPWAQIEGSAEVVALPEAMDVLEFSYRQIAGEHPDWDDYRRAMTAERRVVLRVTPSAAGPRVSG
jgi:PPOX class probable F420-dependent enzyme